jgi:D-alanyl-D-alanine carboxypeptidase
MRTRQPVRPRPPRIRSQRSSSLLPLALAVALALVAGMALFVALPRGPAASPTPLTAVLPSTSPSLELTAALTPPTQPNVTAPDATLLGEPTPMVTTIPLESPVVRTATTRRLTRALQRSFDDLGPPGLVAAVRLPDGTAWYGSLGVLWPGGPDATADSPFAWGSITKTFVATLCLQLVDQGVLNLDVPIATWLPEAPEAKQGTLRMLLAHRSGIFDYFLNPHYNDRVFKRPTHAWTVDEILSLVRRPAFAPGTGFGYSNTNYVLAGLILEQVTGQPLATLIHDRLLVPLGLEESVFQQAGQPVGLVGAKGFWPAPGGFHDWSDGSDFRPNTSAATVAWAAGAMEGSARDLLDWEHALYSGNVLPSSALAQMLAFAPDSGYGMGARTQTLAGQPGYGHGGSVRGFVSVMYRLPVENVDVVVLINLGKTDLDRVANRLVRAVIGGVPTDEPSPSVLVPPSLPISTSLDPATLDR